MNAVDLPARLKSWPAIAAGLLNLVPIVGVLFWGWSAFALIFLYWIENLVIGVRTIASMLSTAASGPAHLVGALAISAFFTVHYGLFCFVHGVFVVSMFGDQTVAGDGLFDLWAVSSHLFATEPGLITGLLSIVLWQVVQFALFIFRGEATRANALELMASPYPRIIVLHITIIFGGFLLMLLGQPLAGLVLLALLKAAFDIAEARGQGFKLNFAQRGPTRSEDGA